MVLTPESACIVFRLGGFRHVSLALVQAASAMCYIYLMRLEKALYLHGVVAMSDNVPAHKA